MAWYLRHFFDPHFDHTALKPRPLPRGRADMRNLGYVQNALPGQVLAELVPLERLPEDEPAPDPRFILADPVLPAGRHTAPDPTRPLRLLATEAGYVFYEGDRIAVKTLLNVRGNVDFHTGNIAFVGKVHVHRDVDNGFSVTGSDVLVDGGVFGGRVRARGDLAVRGGARGDFHAHCLLASGRNLRVGFADKAELRSRHDLDIRQALHSVLLAGGRLLVRRNLNGGAGRARYAAAVGGDLGNASLTPTLLVLGDDPLWSRPLHRCVERLNKARRVVDQCAPLAGHLAPDANDCARRLARARRQGAILEKQQAFLQAGLDRSHDGQRPARLAVAGTVHPGVRLVLDGAALDVEDPVRAALFERRGEKVAILPLESPA